MPSDWIYHSFVGPYTEDRPGLSPEPQPEPSMPETPTVTELDAEVAAETVHSEPRRPRAPGEPMSPQDTYDAIETMMELIPRVAPRACKDTDTCCTMMLGAITSFLMFAMPLGPSAFAAHVLFEWQSSVLLPYRITPESPDHHIGIAFRCRHSIVVPRSDAGFSLGEGYFVSEDPYEHTVQMYSRVFFLVCVPPEVLTLLTIRRRFTQLVDTIAICADSNLRNRWADIAISPFFYPSVDHAISRSDRMIGTASGATVAPAVIQVMVRGVGAALLLGLRAGMMSKCFDFSGASLIRSVVL